MNETSTDLRRPGLAIRVQIPREIKWAPARVDAGCVITRRSRQPISSSLYLWSLIISWGETTSWH